MAGLFDLLNFFKQQQNQDIAGNLLGAEPEAVPGAGEGLSPMSAQALQNYGQDWARFGKGMATGAVGMPGDLVSLGRGLFSAMTPQPQQTRLDALLMGMQKPTLLPTSQDVSKAVDPYLPQFMAGESAPQTIGEIAAPAGLFGKIAKEAAPLVARGIEALPTDLPVGASIKPVVNAPVSDIGMYSALEEAGLNLQRNKGTGQAFLNDLLKAPNVKQEEVRWIGLDDYLKDKPNATKQDVQDFIANNRVDVQEVTLDSSKTVEREKLKEASHQALQRVDEMIPGLSSLDRANLTTFWAPSAQAGNASDLAAIRALNLSEDQMQAVMEYGAAVNRQRDFIESSNGYMAQPKFGQYTLPGGENYREILLTMPAKRLSEDEARKVLGAKPDAKLSDADISYASRKAVDEYRSGHWDQPNVLAHLRVNDRVDADGKKMLLIEEVQSDWHQAGRDKGYRTNETAELPQGTKVFAPGAPDSPGQTNMAYTVQIPRNVNGRNLFYGTTEEEAIANARSFIAQPSQSAVPDAPFKDNWYQLALKRAIKYAADNGYDRIGLTTGSRQAERYDLSKQVEQVLAVKDGENFMIFMRDNAGKNHNAGIFAPNELPGAVGKDLAEKIVAQKNSKETYEGLDLKIGGEGMKKYYDEIYPQFLSKYGKKWGAKVGETSIKTSNKQDVSPSQVQGWDLGGLTPEEFVRKYNTKDNEPVRYIDITPEMKESVKKGQPLFAAVPALPVGSGLMDQMGEKKKTKSKNPRSLMESF